MAVTGQQHRIAMGLEAVVGFRPETVLPVKR